MKKIIALIISLILAGGIVYLNTTYFDDGINVDSEHINSTSLLSQKILSYSNDEKQYHKIYYNDSLIGVINDIDYFYSLINSYYGNYENDFPNTSLGLCDDIHVIPEKSFIKFENIDNQILTYLADNNLLGVKTNAIEFSTDQGVYSIIYVKDLQDFYDAREQFLLNFISSDSLDLLTSGATIPSPETYGSIETGISISETIRTSEAIVSPDKIMKDKKDIYTYLCYGDNQERVYYETKEGDTLQGVGYYNGDMSPKQIVMLNPDVLSSEKQIITPGMKLNVTYYTSPLTVSVTKQDLSQQLVYPSNPTYVQDDTLAPGEVVVLTQEESGMKNVLYEETWINGVLQSGSLKSETITKKPVQGVIAIGTRGTYLSGTSNFIWPLDNPAISCHWGCYLNHTGTDFINKYNHYGNVYAADSGVVYDKGYRSWDMGNYVMIDHQNGLKTWYLHLNVPAYVSIGDYVERGTLIGQIGNTGNSEGAHLHFTVLDNDERVNACYYLPCSLLGG